jgi:hypothetical protein
MNLKLQKFKLTMKIILFLFLNLFYLTLIQGQSLGYIRTSYFEQQSNRQPLRLGKGFDIRDIFSEKDFCFSKENANVVSLTSQSTIPNLLKVKVYHCYKEQEYKTIKTNGYEGKIGFLNLFSVGHSESNENSHSNNSDVERLVFLAKCDFGKFDYGRNIPLIQEAQSLLNQKQNDKFIAKFGTHYVSGVHKEAGVWVTITKKSSNSNDGNSLKSGMKVTSVLNSLNLGFEDMNTNSNNFWEGENSFDVDIDIVGTAVDIDDVDLASAIKLIAESDKGATEKRSEIIENLNRIASKLKDPKKASISGYYYAPFSKYGLDMYWDSNKEQALTEINNLLVRNTAMKDEVFDLSEGMKADDFQNMKGLEDISELRDLAPGFHKFLVKSLEFNSKIEKYRTLTNTINDELQNAQKDCFMLSCDSKTGCCSNNIRFSEIKKQQNIYSKEFDEYAGLVENLRECEVSFGAELIIVNKSSNPYRIEFMEQDEVVREVVQGGGTFRRFVKMRTELNITATQMSGYMLYATVNKRNIMIMKPCIDVTLTIGYED